MRQRHGKRKGDKGEILMKGREKEEISRDCGRGDDWRTLLRRASSSNCGRSLEMDRHLRGLGGSQPLQRVPFSKDSV